MFGSVNRKILSSVVISIVACSFVLGFGNQVRADQEVTFPDKNLERVIREKIGKTWGPIYRNDLIKFKQLIANDREIKSIKGLEYCINLTILDLGMNNISNVSPLANLTNLTTLSLRVNNISDISPLSDLTNLIWLALECNNISDISPLSNLIDLRELDLQRNNVSDISPLSNLTNLKKLFLGENNIFDFSPLSNLTTLEVLWLNKTNISDISTLTNLIDLTELYLRENNISDISPLANLTKLRKLWISENSIYDISPLANLTNLENLSLGENNISDISPLFNLINLTKLLLWQNNIKDINSIKHLIRIGDPETGWWIDLDLSYNQISDISPLVENSGIDEGDFVDICHNPLNSQSIETYIPELENRGVELTWKPVIETPAPRTTPPPTTAVAAPKVPQLLFPLDNSAIKDTPPTFSWEIVTDASTYILQYKKITQLWESSEQRILIGNTNTSYTVDSPLDEANYEWRVKCINSKDIESAWSDIWSLIIDKTPPTTTSPPTTTTSPPTITSSPTTTSPPTIISVPTQPTSSLQHSNSLLYLAIFAAIIICILAVYQITRKKPEKLEEEPVKKELEKEKPKTPEEEASPELQKLLQEKEEWRKKLENLKDEKDNLISKGIMTEEEYQKKYEEIMDQLVDIEDRIIKEKMKGGGKK
ncbi:MAG: hypothetical protein B5M53_00425 [Candidatus Cloacimonas sp. 4484_209]|nr:MAG: hypothetical protein B5M53_00425 [Candidatus Cloacimonas sp. 4484_209]